MFKRRLRTHRAVFSCARSVDGTAVLFQNLRDRNFLRLRSHRGYDFRSQSRRIIYDNSNMRDPALQQIANRQGYGQPQPTRFYKLPAGAVEASNKVYSTEVAGP